MARVPLPPRNPDRGFHGVMVRAGAETGEGADHAWDVAFGAIAAATGATFFGVREFLDSSQGRCFADELCGFLLTGMSLSAAIATTVANWESQPIGRRTALATGIPADLPYLTGFVMWYDVIAERPLGL